jgi:hypothetical protein
MARTKEETVDEPVSLWQWEELGAKVEDFTNWMDDRWEEVRRQGDERWWQAMRDGVNVLFRGCLDALDLEEEIKEDLTRQRQGASSG